MKRKLVGLFVVLAMFVGWLPTVVWAATGNDIANAAWNYLGVSRDVYDCSAFTQKVYSDCGISIPRLTYDQANCGTRIYSRDVNDLKPGDIVCFGSSSNSSDITHVGIYVGNNIVLHSSYSKWQIAQDNMSNWITTGWYTPPYQFAVRVVSGGTPPTNARISANKQSVAVNEAFTLSYSATNATNYRIGYYWSGDSGLHVIEKGTSTSENLKFSQPGKYTIHVQCINAFGSVDTSNITVVVNDNSVYPFTVTKSSTSATVTNNTSEQRKACVIVAKYSSGVLLDTDIYNTVYIAPETPFKINTNSSDYKVFVWDSLSGMKPLAEQ